MEHDDTIGVISGTKYTLAKTGRPGSASAMMSGDGFEVHHPEAVSERILSDLELLTKIRHGFARLDAALAAKTW